MYTTVLFDLDGTLLDTIQDLANAGNHTLSAMGFPKHSIEEYKKMVGNGIPKLIERMLPVEHRGEATQEIAHSIYSKYYQEHLDDFTKPYQGIIEMIEILKQNRIVMGVVTNKADEFAQQVVEQYFPEMFSVVVGTSPQLPAKPNKKIVHWAMQQVGALPEQTLYCGDSDVDMITAKNAMLDSCGVLWGFRSREELEQAGANYLVEYPTQIVEIILEEQ